MVTFTELGAGVALDLVFGDPRWLPHPVSGIALLARFSERIWPRNYLGGIFAWCTVVGITASVVWLTPFLNIYWIYSFLATRSLDDHARAVIRLLERGDLPGARVAVSYIVGRDTEDLDEAGVLRAVVETVAENLSDGVIAPLFWLLIGGPAGMAAYKAINTLDSLFGHKNARYFKFGWASARIDDVANWIPARLTGLLISILAGRNSWHALKTMWRDGGSQPSPNSGYPEAAMAGALGVQLGGLNFYRGVESRKAFMGEPTLSLRPSMYPRIRVMLYGSMLIFVGAWLPWL